jgi:hypothetical protein
LGPVPESPLVPRSETGFKANWPGEPTIEFKVDGQGKVTSALAEFGPNRIPLEPIPRLALSAAILDRYAGEYKNPVSGTVFVFRRDGDKLVVKPGNNAEAALNARSERRFQDPRGPVFEFELDAQGKVTGAVLEQGNPVQRTPLTRVP